MFYSAAIKIILFRDRLTSVSPSFQTMWIQKIYSKVHRNAACQRGNPAGTLKPWRRVFTARSKAHACHVLPIILIKVGLYLEKLITLCYLQSFFWNPKKTILISKSVQPHSCGVKIVFKSIIYFWCSPTFIKGSPSFISPIHLDF